MEMRRIPRFPTDRWDVGQAQVPVDCGVTAMAEGWKGCLQTRVTCSLAAAALNALGALAEVTLGHPRIRAKPQSGLRLVHDESLVAGKAKDQGVSLRLSCTTSWPTDQEPVLAVNVYTRVGRSVRRLVPRELLEAIGYMQRYHQRLLKCRKSLPLSVPPVPCF